jgi:DNA repair protein RadA/Sms
MAKKKETQFVCAECGEAHPRWQGQCNSCKVWNSVAEIKLAPVSKAEGAKYKGYAGKSTGALSISDIPAQEHDRFITGIGEFDRVFGGGPTHGSVNLLSGDPGAGKTTLASQVSAVLSKQVMCMYATSEESLSQFKNRFQKRLKVPFDDTQLKLMNEADVDVIIQQAIDLKVKFLIIDSIQSIVGNDFTGGAGSISQVKGCAQRLTQFAKNHDVTIIAIAHVNKQNEVAGPMTLVHIVDGLFHIEVNDSELRTIRPSKNRFGDVDTVGLFKMSEKGMLSVDNPSKIFLSSLVEPTPGTAISCIRDGNRNLLLEIQALTTASENDFVERVCVGLSFNRLKMISAILRKHGKVKMNHDIYVSLVGGLKLPETDASADLALVAALYGSLKDKTLDRKTCFMGELSLSGEVRPVSGGVPRVKEAIKHGFETIYLPHANYHSSMESKGVKLIPLKTIHDLLKNIN